ncbi:hypothetical protein [uncultured Duncaniella sp.]|uniref:hypothetical protein n=1 Tax=uncultured Duncaniella sp. TaxID=2768039 RepID=UPI0026224522|nr:hypothetical protein [uncultured Duncaniella sp.]
MKNFTSFIVAIALGISASICHAQEPRTAMENDTIAVDNVNDTKVETSGKKEREKEDLNVPLEKPIIMTLTFGKCINMGGHENSEWLGRRRGQTNELDWRFAYFFLRHWGMYVDCAIYGSSIASDCGPLLEKQLGTKFHQDDECGAIFAGAIAGIGITYRMEWNRWQLLLRGGIGTIGMNDSWTSTRDYDLTDDPGYDRWEMPYTRWECNRYLSPSFLNGGLTIGYRMSRVFSVILDINYRHTVGEKAYMCLTKYEYAHTEDDFEPRELIHFDKSSRAWGRDLTVSIGLQLQVESSKKGMQAYRSRQSSKL